MAHCPPTQSLQEQDLPSTSMVEIAKFKEKIGTVSFFGDAPFENADPWFSYIIENVPRNYGKITRTDEEWKYILETVTTEAMHEALCAAAGVAPMAIMAS
ncbi:hypothetical protein BGT96224_Ac30164 [Blumeria graminis f. sp. tritici 96224]|nr:hypothetical protein BGT96224_Ac30164 [Blumeria graminis f. sp. tritici 96224]